MAGQSAQLDTGLHVADAPAPDAITTRTRDRFRLPRGRQARLDTRRDFRSLGVPPADASGASSWTHQALAVALYHAINDADLSELERRREMRHIARAMAAVHAPGPAHVTAEARAASERNDRTKRRGGGT